MIFIVSWCYGGLAMVIFILFWQGSYPPWWHHTGIFFVPTWHLTQILEKRKGTKIEDEHLKKNLGGWTKTNPEANASSC